MALLAGCGATSVTSPPPVQANTSAPTVTSGPIVIGTDHSVYAPNGTIQVTVTNYLTVPFTAYDTRATCSIFSLQMMQSDGTWVNSNVARCPLGRPALAVVLAPNATKIYTITAGYAGLDSKTVFPVGTYRLMLDFTTSKPATPNSPMSQAVSQTFTVAA